MSQRYEEDEVLGKAYDARLMKRLLGYVRPYKLPMAAALSLLLAISLLDLAGPYLTKVAIDQFIARGDLAGLAPIALLYMAVISSMFLLRYGQTYLLNLTGQRAMHDLRMELFAHLQRMSLSFFDRRPVGMLLTRLTNDVEALNEMLTSGILAIFSDVVTLSGIMVVLLLLNFKLALVAFAVIPVLLIMTRYFQRAMRDSYRAIRTRLARINAYVQENVSGMLVVQLFNRQAANFKAFDSLNQDYLEANLRSLRLHATFYPAVTFMGSVAIAMLIWYGGGGVLEGSLTLGSLVAFIQYVERFFQPIRDLSEKYNIMQAAMASSERIFKLLDTEETIKDPPNPIPLVDLTGEIEFRDVSFAYNHEFVLRDVSFRLAPGESVALVGATGAGKTTIINLLCRFYDPQKGQILVDGTDLRQLDQRELRRHIGVVLQDPFLFAGTIEQNIKLLDRAIPFDAVERAARLVNAHGFIQNLPRGYQEEVKERGAGLSVGQKQLVAFARAIAFNPRILLVLDEATSSVDGETERLIQDALARIMQGRTSVIIAHRLSTVRNASRILVLHKGRLVEEGSHGELLAQGGVYARLYQLQYNGAATAEAASSLTHPSPRS